MSDIKPWEVLEFGTDIHRAASVEIERVDYEGSKWVKMVVIDLVGTRNCFNVFGTNGELVDELADKRLDRAKKAEAACEELRRQSEVADENHAELESKLSRCREALNVEQDGNAELHSQLADAQRESADAESTIAALTATVENGTQEAAARTEDVERLTAELRTINAAYESAQERGSI